MARDLKYGKVSLEKGDIPEDEPVFIFRAQDRMLVEVLYVYRSLCTRYGSPEKHIDSITRNIEEIKAWQSENHTQIPVSKDL